MTLFLFVSNFELSKHLSVFVPLWLDYYKENYQEKYLWMRICSIATFPGP